MRTFSLYPAPRRAALLVALGLLPALAGAAPRHAAHRLLPDGAAARAAPTRPVAPASDPRHIVLLTDAALSDAALTDAAPTAGPPSFPAPPPPVALLGAAPR